MTFFVSDRGAGRNRTDECQICSLVPYHLATAPNAPVIRCEPAMYADDGVAGSETAARGDGRENLLTVRAIQRLTDHRLDNKRLNTHIAPYDDPGRLQRYYQ